MKIKILLLTLCGLVILLLSSCNKQADNNEEYSEHITTLSETTSLTKSDKISSKEDAYTEANKKLNSFIMGKFHSIIRIDVSEYKIEEATTPVKEFILDSEGNKIETEEYKDGNIYAERYESKMVYTSCFFVTLYGTASGYTDNYDDDFNKMTFKLKISVIKSTGEVSILDSSYEFEF